jgi:hypothetical protein
MQFRDWVAFFSEHLVLHCFSLLHCKLYRNVQGFFFCHLWSDQMISYTNSIVKSFKWWKRWSSMFWLLQYLTHTSCSSLRIQILLSHTESLESNLPARRSSCCGALTGLPALTTTVIALFCTSSTTSYFLKTLCVITEFGFWDLNRMYASSTAIARTWKITFSTI